MFAGPIKLEGASMRTLTRWAAGDRDITGQASTGDFALAANATVGDGAVKLADVQGELSGTKFGGSLNYEGGERSLIEVNLDSDRLDLREMIGEGPIWRAWLSAANGNGQAADGSAPNVLTQVRDDDLRVTVEVGELLLPNVPPGRLDARFTLVDDVVDVQKLDFAAADELKLTGSGRIEHLSDRPAGRVGFAFRAATTDSLRIASKLAGLPEDVSKSKYLSSLAPLDIEVGLAATREGDATKAVLELGGNAAGSDLALTARAVGEPTRLGEANIDLDGSVTGERPQALLVLLFPNLPADRFTAPGGNQGKLSVELSGVPNVNMTGKLALETKAMTLAFDGQGSFQESGLALQGRGSIATQDASLALMMADLEAPPSAANVPLSLSAYVVKEGGNIAVDRIAGTVAGETVAGTAHFDTSGERTRFTLHADAGAVSLPSLLGVLVGWQRTPSTEEGLGAVGAGASEVWPSRGFALGAIEHAEGELKLNAKTLSLGRAFPLTGATLAAQVTKEGLTVTDLRGGLFGGTFGASGSLSARGAGAEFEAIAELKGGKLEQVSAGIVGEGLAKGAFDLTFTAQGEGLSPPGLVAGLSGQGTLSLGPGSVHPLSAEPLRQFAATTARKKTKVSKEQIAADARAVGEKLTSGLYKYPASKLAFDIKNGTLRLQPATLQGSGVETKINAYVELASLKLDSEWAMTLTGAANKAIPPVSLVFVGALDKAGEIAPAVDTAAIESYLTLRRLQEDVEKLETLDVSGRTPPQEEPAAEAPAEPIRAEDAPAEPAPKAWHAGRHCPLSASRRASPDRRKKQRRSRLRRQPSCAVQRMCLRFDPRHRTMSTYPQQKRCRCRCRTRHLSLCRRLERRLRQRRRQSPCRGPRLCLKSPGPKVRRRRRLKWRRRLFPTLSRRLSPPRRPNRLNPPLPPLNLSLLPPNRLSHSRLRPIRLRGSLPLLNKLSRVSRIRPPSNLRRLSLPPPRLSRLGRNCPPIRPIRYCTPIRFSRRSRSRPTPMRSNQRKRPSRSLPPSRAAPPA